jgi:hypothetical protein
MNRQQLAWTFIFLLSALSNGAAVFILCHGY